MPTNEDDASSLSGVLTGAQQSLLWATLAAHPRGLFADIDGTLSAIAPTPAQATLLPGVRELLLAAQRVFDVVAVVSGRDPRDALRLVGIPNLISIGSHGLERLEPIETKESEHATDAAAQSLPPMRSVVYPRAEPYRERIAQALAAIGDALAAEYPGLRLEDKGVTASIHVRQTADPPSAEEAVFARASEVAAPLGLRVTRGKLVIELRPPVAMNKGLAIAALIHERGLRSAIYLGDDRTDIDAFRALRKLNEQTPTFCGVSVAVLSVEAPPTLAEEADITLDSITRVPALLRWLVQTSEQRQQR